VEKVEKVNKKRVIFIAIILILFIGVITFVFLHNTNEKKLERSLRDMGKDFYENYYYDQTGETEKEKEAFLAKFKTVGIKVNLDNLSRYKNEENAEKIKAFVNKDTKKECNKETTRVIIYPQEKYGKTDYDLKVELDCGFDKNSNSNDDKK